MTRTLLVGAVVLLLGCSTAGRRDQAPWPVAPAAAFAQPFTAFLQATYRPTAGTVTSSGVETSGVDTSGVDTSGVDTSGAPAPASAPAAGPSGQLQLAVDSAGGTMQVVIMDALGRRLATLQLDGRSHELRREAGARIDLASADLVAALQLTFWPLETLQAATRGTPWRVDGGQERRLWYHGDLLAAAAPGGGAGLERWRGRYRYLDYRHGRRIDFHSTVTSAPVLPSPTQPIEP